MNTCTKLTLLLVWLSVLRRARKAAPARPACLAEPVRLSAVLVLVVFPCARGRVAGSRSLPGLPRGRPSISARYPRSGHPVVRLAAQLTAPSPLTLEPGSAALSTVHRQTVRGPLAANGCCATLTSTAACKVAFGGRENDLTLFDCSNGGGELKQVRSCPLSRQVRFAHPTRRPCAGVVGPEHRSRLPAPASAGVCECGGFHR